MAFEDLESLSAETVIHHLGNCDVVLGGQPGRGIFDAEAVAVLDQLVDSPGPQVQVLTSLAPALVEGADATVTRKVNAVSTTTAYSVVGFRPDGTGLTVVSLRLA